MVTSPSSSFVLAGSPMSWWHCCNLCLWGNSPNRDMLSQSRSSQLISGDTPYYANYPCVTGVMTDWSSFETWPMKSRLTIFVMKWIRWKVDHWLMMRHTDYPNEHSWSKIHLRVSDAWCHKRRRSEDSSLPTTVVAFGVLLSPVLWCCPCSCVLCHLQ